MLTKLCIENISGTVSSMTLDIQNIQQYIRVTENSIKLYLLDDGISAV